MRLKLICFFCYNFFIIPALSVGSYILFPVIKKIRQGVLGRRGMFARLSAINFEKISRSGRKIIWFHVASAGEFEQALPIISEVKDKYKNVFILVTFFSPSGYFFYKKKEFDFIDFAEYSPLDTPVNVIRFLNIVKPDILILTRYDIWPNMIWFSWLMRVKILMINGSLQKFSKRFKFAARFFYKSIYSCFQFIGTITEDDAERFKGAVSSRTKIIRAGDTKYDRVISRKESQNPDPALENIFYENVMIAASVWDEDEQYLFPTARALFREFKGNFSFIVVPHEPDRKRLDKWENFFKGNNISATRLSTIRGSHENRLEVLLVDRVGFLAELYRLSTVAYVGGGFSSGGVHNILEPSIYGNPTMFGLRYQNSYEARLFIRENISKLVTDKDEIIDYARELFSDKKLLMEIGEKHIARVKELCGATDRYLNYIGNILEEGT